MLLILCVAVLVAVDSTYADCDNSQSSSYAQASSYSNNQQSASNTQARSSSNNQQRASNTPRCGPNEYYTTCGTACPDTCDNYDDPNRVCTQQCVEGCFCYDGYVRNPDGYCIPPQNCPRRCGPNEYYTTCGTACPDTCDNYNDPNRVCTQQCVEGCFCYDGYVRNQDGYCVPTQNCPRRCPSNSHYDECGTPCPKTCDNINDPPSGCAAVCNPSCQCDKGYILNRDKQCVRPSQCPARTSQPVCGRNEHYTNCGTACPDTCDNYDEPNRVCTAQCVIGCECDGGYVRNPDGYCVLPQNCPIRCGRNEHYESCGTACPDTCDDYDDPNKVCTQQCIEGCFCDDGYVRDPDGYCVQPRNCPISCGRYEHYESCGTACPDTCDNYRDKDRVCTAQCVDGCFCDDGYVRNGTGYCVPPRNCPKACGRNEHYNNCGTACPDTCENYDRSDRVCTKQCVSGCECDKGYVRNERGNCILPRHCPIRCNQNEHYERCASACPDTCDNYNDPNKVCNGACRPGCACNQGYVRNKRGDCIPILRCNK